MEDIRFFFPEPVSGLRRRGELKHFLARLARKEGYSIRSLVYVFCDDDYLFRINRDFLGHDDLTDIITFSFSENSRSIEGEIYISSQRVRENAEHFAVGMNQELHRVIFHGLLHLCGYKDKLKADQAIMRAKEQQYLDLYFKRR
jgi:probable rRNA maturation factor